MTSWRPRISLANLKKRAEYINKIRMFFQEREIIEVETPTISQTTIPDPYIHSLEVNLFNHKYYLQTSPEFHMKRLLAAGSGSIFQICKAFRNDELGRLHNPEFTMLEWYRVDFSAHDLMREMDVFFQSVFNFKPAKIYTYAGIFKEILDVDPLIASTPELQTLAEKQNIVIQGLKDNKDDWLNLLMSHCIEPELNQTQQPYFIYQFPISQAALAKPSPQNPHTAERFEVYMHGIELANGFHELTDVNEQRQRFQRYLDHRKQLNLPEVPMPELFLEALENGLPDCSGVAVGIDRLIMLALGESKLASVLAFDFDNA